MGLYRVFRGTLGVYEGYVRLIWGKLPTCNVLRELRLS